MPQIFYSPLQGTFFSPNPALEPNEGAFEDPRKKERPNSVYSSVSDSFIENTSQRTVVAKSGSVPNYHPDYDQSFAFLYESPTIQQTSFVPHSDCIIFTPQVPDLELDPQNQVWTPNIGNSGRRESVTTSRLSFNESYPPSATTFDESIDDIGFLNGHGRVIEMANDIPRQQELPIGLGIATQDHPAQMISHRVHESQVFCNTSGEEYADDGFDLFIKESPKVDEAQEYHSDSQNYDRAIPASSNPPKIGSDIKQEKSEISLLSSPGPCQHSSMPKKHGTSTPRKLKKAKSFGGGITKYISSNNFSLDECLNEFHIQEGKILFQDETARVVKHSGSPFISRRKSAPKLSGAFQPIRKSKTSENLLSRIDRTSNEGISKDMASGLISFQLDFGSKSSPKNEDTTAQVWNTSPVWTGKSE